MCGFAGAIGARGNDPLLGERMTAALAALQHRGPDGEGVKRGADWLLGFRRLAILDLSDAGAQPMLTPEADAVLVFNGEIYNYRALRQELAAAGEDCRSSGDSEVLLRLLRRHGRAALAKLNGMFAFAFVDLRQRRFLLARDRCGVKPLYWQQTGQGLAFASELPALLAIMGDRPAVDPLAVNRYLAFGHIPPPLSIWSGVSKLAPGHCVEGSLDAVAPLAPAPWWQLGDVCDRSRDTPAWLDEIDALLLDATRLRLESDVPVGLFLSGGIDSGLVAHYLAQSPAGKAVKALTVTFDQKEYSEIDLARRVAHSQELEHHATTVRADSLDELPTIAWHCGEPFGDSSVVNQYLVARAARPLATVFLGGDGGDEAFAGYDEYVRMARWGGLAAHAASVAQYAAPAFATVLPPDSLLQYRLWKLSGGPNDFGAMVRQHFRHPFCRRVLAPDWLRPREEVESQTWDLWHRSEGLPLVTRMQRFDYVQYLESDVLVKVDRATMAHSIESRSPLLDYRVVELAARIPVELKLQGGTTKTLLRRLAQRHLPVEVGTAPKRGFGLPVRRWFESGLKDRARRLLTSTRARSRGYWDAAGLAYVLGRHDKRPTAALDELVWRYLMLEMWARVFLDGDRSPWTQ